MSQINKSTKDPEYIKPLLDFQIFKKKKTVTNEM